MRLVAIRKHSYPHQTVREIGDEYDEVTKGDGCVLVAARLARHLPEGTQCCPAGPDGQQGPPGYQVKEQAAEPLAAEKPVRKKRQYKRRDMNP